MRLWITGFGSFRTISDNPSAALAMRLAVGVDGFEVESRILPVTYADALTAAAAIPPADLIVAMGVHGGDAVIRLETQALRTANETSDMAGTAGDAASLPPGPETIPSRIVIDPTGLEAVQLSDDAGGYLCNFWYYCLLASTETPCIFIHVPHSEVSRPDGPHIALDQQEKLVRRVIALLRARL